MSRFIALASSLSALSLAACAGLPAAPRAPEPAKSIDAARFYSGTWYEIARRPMWITNNCVAGTTTYSPSATADVQVLDACDMERPGGKRKTIGGPGRILDPGTNAKLRVDYPLWFDRDFWVLDRADDYSWFISADPSMRDLYIFTRDPRVSAETRAMLVERARSLGYPVETLEFPAMP